jgi:hypothetical protein
MPRLDLRVVTGVMFLLAAITAAPSDAQTTFTSRTAWEAAVRSRMNIDFEGIAPARGDVSFPGGRLSLLGVTFQGAGDVGPSLIVIDPGEASYVAAWSSGAMLMTESLGTGIGQRALSPPGSISLPSGVSAFGFNYAVSCAFFVGPGGPCSAPWTVLLSTGQLITIPAVNPPPTMAFWGTVSSVPISAVQIQPPATFLLLDNFSFETPVIFSPTTLPAGSVGVPYSQAFTTSGGALPPLGFVGSSTTAPGLTFNNATGVMSGTPTTAGTFQVQIDVQDTGRVLTFPPVPLTIAAAVPALSSWAVTALGLFLALIGVASIRGRTAD